MSYAASSDARAERRDRLAAAVREAEYAKAQRGNFFVRNYALLSKWWFEANLNNLSLYIFPPSSGVRRNAKRLCEWIWFERIILGTIIANCATLALYKPLEGRDSSWNKGLESAEFAFTAIFTIEFFVNVVAKNFLFGPPESDVYLRDGWRILDFAVVVGGWISLIMLAAGQSGGGVTAVRGIRAIRPLRSIAGFPALRIFVSTTLSSMAMVFDVIIFLVVVVAIFGILGVQRFAGKLSNRCAFASTMDLVIDEAEWPCSNSTLGRSCSSGQVCIATGIAGMESGFSTFNNIFGATFIIYRVFTLRGWTDLMYQIIDATGDSVAAYIYFVLLIAIGAVFAQSFMLAVVTAKYKQAAVLDEQRALDDVEKDPQPAPVVKAQSLKRQATVRVTYGRRFKALFDKPIAYMHTTAWYQSPLKKLIKSKPFEWSITGAILINTLILAVQYRGMHGQIEAALTNLNIALLSVFVLEMLLKVLALGILGYGSDRYNVFDAIIVFAGLIELSFQDSSLAVARAFRLLRVLRVSRLVSRSKSMRRLLDACMDGFGAILSFTGVLIIFVFVFTVLGMQLFGGTAEFYDVRPNFNTFGDSFMSVFEILTGSNWYKLMLIAMSGPSGAGAALFFIAWSFLGSFILLNLVIGMLVDTFARSKKAKERELKLLAEEAKHKQEEEANAARLQEMQASTKSSIDGIDDDMPPVLTAEVPVESAAAPTSKLKLMRAEDVQRHPDAKKILERIKVRRQRKFAREVDLIESWLEDAGLDAGSDSDSGVEDDNKGADDRLARDREAMLTSDEIDDGMPEGSMTALMSQKFKAKVTSFVQMGVPIPSDDRQVRSSYRRWKIDTAAERAGEDSDEETRHIVDADVSNTDDLLGSRADTVNHLREQALNNLRQDILNQDRRMVNTEALSWASTHSHAKPVMKSAAAQLRPKEQTAVLAQRSAEGQITGQLGKFKGPGVDIEGLSVIAEANKLSNDMKLAQMEARKKERMIGFGAAKTEEVAPSTSDAPSSETEMGWRTKLKQKGSSGVRRSSIADTLKSFDDRPRPGPVTESYDPDDADTLSNSHSARSPRNSSFRSRSETTGDQRDMYHTLLPVVEHTEMPAVMGVDFSLPRMKEDLRAAKSRKALGLPVRDIVIDQTRIKSAEVKAEDEEDWMAGGGHTNNDPECMKYASLGCIGSTNTLRRLLFMVIKHNRFEMLMLAIIVLSCVQLALDAPTVEPMSDLAKVLKAADVSFTLIFLCESIFKTIAFGFAMHPGAYLRSVGNCFDFFIVVVSLAVETMNVSSLRFMRSFRLFRALRPLRLLNRVKSMQIVVATLVHVMPDLGGILLLGFFQFLVFAILGTQFFSGKYDYCNDPVVSGKATCVGTFINSKGVHLSREWLHPPLNFDNTLNALLTLFVIVTRDGWLEMAFQGMDSTGLDIQPKQNKNGWSAIYFLLCMITLSFVWLAMIVAIVCEHYRKASELSTANMTLTDEQKEWSEVLRMKRHSAKLAQLDDNEGGAPRFFVRKSAYSFVTDPRFESFIIGCIVANTVTMASFHHGQPSAYGDIQRAGNVMFSWIFLFELGLKLLALFPARYFAEPWNVFDFVVVMSSIPDLVGVDFVGTAILRVMRLGRVLRLFRQAKGLRAVFNTCVKSIESVFHVVFLIFMLMFVYAVLGMSLFEDYETKTFTGRQENFRDFGASLAVLLRVITRDNWKRTMFDTMECDYDIDGVAANCNRVIIPALFFMSFILMGSYVLMSLIIAAILDKFTESAVDEGLLSTANIFTTVKRKLLLDTFANKLKMKLAQHKALSKGRDGQNAIGRKRGKRGGRK